MKNSHVLLAVATAALWGFGFVTSKYGADNMPPLFFLALRFTLVSLALLWFLRVPRGQLAAVAIFSLVMGGGHFGLFYIALNLGVEASTASIIWLTQIPMGVILAALFLGERPGWVSVGGITVAFAGVIVLIGEPRHMSNGLAIAIMLASSAAWAVGNVLAKRLANIPPLTLNAWMGVFSMVLLYPLSFGLESGQIASLVKPDWWLHGSLIYQVIGSTLLAYWAWYHLLARNPVSTVTGFMLLVPLFGFVAGILALGEPMTWQSIAGGCGTLFGVSLIVLYGRKSVAAASG